MLKLVVCIKQVPMVSELPWDAKTGTLRREVAEGMINPACRHALEAALLLKHRHDAHITTITMGPEMAEEILHEAIAMGADCGILLTDRQMAGADTRATALTLARAIEKKCPDFDLLLCGCQTSDSETAQVGPQLMEELDIPGVAYVDQIELEGRTARMKRLSDDFLETLEMDLPGLVTVSTRHYSPRYAPMAGLQDAFGKVDIVRLSINDLELDPEVTGIKGSPTKILNVYSPTAQKDNIVMKGTARKIVDQLFERFEDRIGGAIGKDIKGY
ncbi:MAG: electron transfer flavoprotein subunit beta/FixA family protein [Proteobacteria bacterium]|nr:electron transfer flavoprotein subunit beta/FixA family protein [Pseudomonadota bacterium]